MTAPIAWLCRLSDGASVVSEFAVLQEPKAPFGVAGVDFPLHFVAEVTPLVAADDAAAADRDRLDFLDSLNAGLNARFGTQYAWQMVINHNVNRLMLKFPYGVDINDTHPHGFGSVRNVIDREMSRITAARRIDRAKAGAA